jgi:flagellar biosynthesis/type III secretory pathway M-ring protein FliF/YscJ
VSCFAERRGEVSVKAFNIHERWLEAGMAIFDDMLKGGNIVTGLAIGVGFALLAPVVKPIVRPLAKTAVKAGLAAYDQGRVALAELGEQAGDMVAEVRSEMDEEAASSDEHARRKTAGRLSEGKRANVQSS